MRRNAHLKFITLSESRSNDESCVIETDGATDFIDSEFKFNRKHIIQGCDLELKNES